MTFDIEALYKDGWDNLPVEYVNNVMLTVYSGNAHIQRKPWNDPTMNWETCADACNWNAYMYKLA